MQTHTQSQAEKLLNVTPQLPPKKNIAYFGAETKTKNAAGNGVDSSGPQASHTQEK